MRLLATLLLTAANLTAADHMEAFGFKWSVPTAADWRVESQDGKQVMQMLTARPPDKDKPRKPTQFALADTADFEKVTLEAEVKRLAKSLIIVYAYRDDLHFNYAHLSGDSAKEQIVHNGIFHVYGGDRVRISRAEAPASLPAAGEWYKVRLDYDATSGTVDVTVNGQPNTSLHGIDLSLGAGQVGLGSFFETAVFRDVRITGRTMGKL